VDEYKVSLNPDIANDPVGKVNVTGTISYDVLLAKIQKTGKEVCSFGVHVEAFTETEFPCRL
jgi:hypothetical protein